MSSVFFHGDEDDVPLELDASEASSTSSTLSNEFEEFDRLTPPPPKASNDRSESFAYNVNVQAFRRTDEEKHPQFSMRAFSTAIRRTAEANYAQAGVLYRDLKEMNAFFVENHKIFESYNPVDSSSLTFASNDTAFSDILLAHQDARRSFLELRQQFRQILVDEQVISFGMSVANSSARFMEPPTKKRRVSESSEKEEVIDECCTLCYGSFKGFECSNEKCSAILCLTCRNKSPICAFCRVGKNKD